MEEGGCSGVTRPAASPPGLAAQLHALVSHVRGHAAASPAHAGRRRETMTKAQAKAREKAKARKRARKIGRVEDRLVWWDEPDLYDLFRGLLAGHRDMADLMERAVRGHVADKAKRAAEWARRSAEECAAQAAVTQAERDETAVTLH
jgi:hypothetical protein